MADIERYGNRSAAAGAVLYATDLRWATRTGMAEPHRNSGAGAHRALDDFSSADPGRTSRLHRTRLGIVQFATAFCVDPDSDPQHDSLARCRTALYAAGEDALVCVDSHGCFLSLARVLYESIGHPQDLLLA